MKKYLFLIFLTFSAQGAFCQTPKLLFKIEKGIENNTEIVAVPFVMYANGIYSKVPVCEIGSTDSKAIQECNFAKETILPLVSNGRPLFKINNGQVFGVIKIVNATQYGFSDWQTYSAKLPFNPNVNLLTNLPSNGIKPVIIIKSIPVLQKRNKDGGGYYIDKLIGRYDIDGDNIPEFIFQSEDYEGHYFQIFSFKNNYWQQVFEGGYQGV